MIDKASFFVRAMETAGGVVGTAAALKAKVALATVPVFGKAGLASSVALHSTAHEAGESAGRYVGESIEDGATAAAEAIASYFDGDATEIAQTAIQAEKAPKEIV